MPDHNRPAEIMYIAPDRRDEWLAGQLDELSLEIHEFRKELAKLRQVLTGILISVCMALIVLPVAVLLRK